MSHRVVRILIPLACAAGVAVYAHVVRGASAATALAVGVLLLAAVMLVARARLMARQGLEMVRLAALIGRLLGGGEADSASAVGATRPGSPRSGPSAAPVALPTPTRGRRRFAPSGRRVTALVHLAVVFVVGTIGYKMLFSSSWKEAVVTAAVIMVAALAGERIHRALEDR